MSRLVTLSKGSPQFESYLLGTFSQDQRALPVQSLNVNSAAETVTFKIVQVQDIQRPSWLGVALRSLKVRRFLLLLVPMFLILTKNLADEKIRDPWTTIIATFGVLFAFISINLRNDYMDHLNGVDRIFSNSGSRSIQNGWMTAVEVKKLANVFLTLASLCALPVTFAFPIILAVIAIATAVGLWAQFMSRHSYKDRLGGELAVFLLLGPLLTVGYQLSMGAPYDPESFWLGCVWGWGVLFVVHLKNFTNILPSSQAGFTNTINWLGFDNSRRLLAFWWLTFVAVNLLYHYNYAGSFWGFYLSVALLLVSSSFIVKLKRISSPVGGELRQVFKYGFTLFLITIGLWVFECLWYLST